MFKSRLSQWKCCYLSMEDRLSLIKFVLCLILIYFLCVCVLPMRVWNQLYSLMSRFPWSGTDERRKLHLVDWRTMTSPCDREGVGLGISELSSTNVALLAKWVYRYVNDRNHLWRKIVSTKNGSNQNRMILVINQSSRRSSLFNLIIFIIGRNS